MNIVLDKLDDVEESDRQFFEETEDKKFKFNRAKFEQVAKAGVDKKNKELLGKIAKVKDLTDEDIERIKKLKANPDRITSFDEWLEAQDDDDDDDNKGKKPDQVDVKKIVKEELKKAQQAHQAALAEKDKAIEAERSKFDNYKFEQSLAEEALEAGVIGSRLKKFKFAAIAEGVFGYREGKLVVLDDDGEPTTEAPADRMRKLAGLDEWKFFFEAKEAGGGSGHQKGASKTAGGKELKRSTMTPKEKSDYIKEHGNDKFLKLPFK